MFFDISAAMIRILFLVLFPVRFFWLGSACRIGVRHDFSAVSGSTIWCKFFASFGLSRHAHMPVGRGLKGASPKASPSSQV